MRPSVCLCLEEAAGADAASLARRFGIPWFEASGCHPGKPAQLRRFLEARMAWSVPGAAFAYVDDGLELLHIGADGVARVRADFRKGAARYRLARGGGAGQPVCRAVGVRGGAPPPPVTDATAGLGADAFALAGVGCEVGLHERVPEVHALLADGLARGLRHAAASGDRELEEALRRMRLYPVGDVRETLGERAADTVYLDPMFPEAAKRARSKKGMWLLRELAGEDADAAGLLEWALARARGKVVVKRSRHAPYLGERKPAHSLTGKRNRFDTYMAGDGGVSASK